MAKRSARTSSGSPARKDETPPRRAAGAAPRKLVAFDSETWHAIDLLGKDSFMTFQELADEAFRDLLRKHGRPVELRDQLKRSLPKPPPKRRGSGD
jgi:hypothetical protein